MGIPTNIVIAWSGSIANIPDGWFLCNGQNGTPNCVDRFIVGSGNAFTFNTTGGSTDSVAVTHNHTTGATNTAGAHAHGFSFVQSGGNFPFNGGSTNATASRGTTSNGAHSHSITLSSTGESGINKNLPPYFALAFIMYGGD